MWLAPVVMTLAKRERTPGGQQGAFLTRPSSRVKLFLKRCGCVSAYVCVQCVYVHECTGVCVCVHVCGSVVGVSV